MNKQETVASLNSHTGFFRHWMPREQRMALMKVVEGEEGEHFVRLLTDLKARIEAMPHTYQTEEIDAIDKVVHLHYFKGSVDAWIVEKDKGDGTGDLSQLQAYGKCTLFGGGIEEAEWGYISIAELIQNGVELDLYWTKRTIREV